MGRKEGLTMKRIKTVAIVGAGALGVLYGTLFTEGLGADRVFLAADGARVDRYRRDGLWCNGKRCAFSYEAADGESPRKADLIIFSVKFGGLEAAVESVRPLVHEDTVMISLLNGITSEEVIAKAYGRDRVVCCIAQGMDATRDGNRVEYRNKGVLVIGARDGIGGEALEALKDCLEEADVPYECPEDVWYCMWDKLMLNTGVNQVTAVFNTTYRGIQVPGTARDTMVAAMEEVAQVAEREGISLTEENISRWLKLLDTLNPDGMPSMCQDTRAGRKTEVELFSGTVRRLGQRHGIPTPVNDWLYEKIRELEERPEKAADSLGEGRH